MLRLLRQISLRQFRTSWGRTCLVVGGIATGLSLIVAIDIINTSVLENFRRTIELIAGPAALEVTLGVGEVGFPETVVDTVRTDPDVAAAVPLVRGTISLADDPAETLQLFGADLTAEEDLARYRITLTTDRRRVLQSLDDPRSILLTVAVARRLGVEVGRHVKLSTPQGMTDFTVAGLLEPEGLARVFGGQLAIMDLPAAQIALGKDAKIDQVDVVLRPAADIVTVQRRLAASLPPSLQVARPEQRGAQYERIVSSFQAMLTGLSLLCLVAGVYIIYNTTSTGAVQRGLVMAGLRVVGADPSRLFRLLMLEALILGSVGTALGIPAGVVLARLLTGMVSDSMGVIFQLRFPVEVLAIDARRQVVNAALGIAAALFASYFAARRTTRLEPLAVLRGDARTLAPPPRSRLLVSWWVILVAVAAIALFLEVRLRSIAWGNFGSTVWNASVLVIAVPLVSFLAPRLSRLLSRRLGPEGRVAGESLSVNAARAGVTVAAVALVLTVAIMVATLSRSHRESVRGYFVSGFLASDLAVTAVATEGGWLESPLPNQIAADLAEVSGVRSVDVMRIVPGVMFQGERIALAGLSDGLLAPERYPPGWYTAGDPRAAARAVSSGRGANVSISFADRFGVTVGDEITLASPTGPVILRIAGVVTDYISDRGTILISRRLFADRWLDSTVNRIHVFLADPSRLEGVRTDITSRAGGRYAIKILSMREGVEYLAGKIDRAYAFTYAIQLLIVVVTVAGIFDLLTAAIWERRRELALWRVIGADERTVRRSVVIESATLGALGAFLGIAVGLVTALIWVRINYRYLLGYYLHMHFAAGTTVWLVAITITMSIGAGYAAATRATRHSVLEGIQAD